MISINRAAKMINWGRISLQWNTYGKISAEDIATMEAVIEGISLSEDMMESYVANINAVSVDNLDTKENQALAAQYLEDEGIVIIPGFLSEASAIKAKQSVDEAYSLIKSAAPNIDYEDDRIYVHNTGEKFGSYKELQSYNKAVADVRKGKDSGMIDIFNIDFFQPESFSELRSALASDAILKLLSESGNNALKPANLNAYINCSITSTRGFHIDADRKSLKAFVYLTDTDELSKGPYCYVRGTHKKNNAEKRMNKKLMAGIGRKDTDAPFVDPRKVTPALGRKGTLIISDQSGIHRGIPQIAGAERYVSVMRYL